MMVQQRILKYPRTQHIEGSRLQHGDEDLSQVRFSDVKGKHLVIEEKVDGANSGISFSDEGDLLLQSRGHFLIGGSREKHWTLFKQWANVHCDLLFDVLQDRYIMYGEWMYAKHTVYYDMLPHYFMEFDVYDRQDDIFLSTRRRNELLRGTPIEPVLVLKEGPVVSLEELRELVVDSHFKSPSWKDSLFAEIQMRGLDQEMVVSQTDMHTTMEGLYIKVEDDDRVIQRLKWVRPTFLNSILDSETHWLDRPIVPNRLAPGIDIFSRESRRC